MDQTETTPGAEQPPPAPKKKPKPRSRALARRPQEPAPITHLDFNTVPGFELAQRRASALAGSSVVPEAYRGPMGSQGYCNTLIALELAHRLDFPVMLVMQNLAVVDGRPGWQGKFFVALIQSQTTFKDFAWEWKGEPGQDEYGARMFATRASDGMRCVGQWVDVKLARAEGWWSKKSREGKEYSKWPTMTAQMLVYRSAAFWSAQWNPGATLGIRSVEEEIDATRAEHQLTAPPPPAPALSAASAVIEAPAQPVAPGALPAATSSDPFQELRSLLETGNKREAIAAIGRLPREHRQAAQQLYNSATSKRTA